MMLTGLFTNPCASSSNSPTNTITKTPSATPTASQTSTFYVSATTSATPTKTFTATITPTDNNINTLTQTETNTPTFSATFSSCCTPTMTPALNNEGVFQINNVIIYPNPNNDFNDLKIVCDITKPINKLTVNIYTNGFRKVIGVPRFGNYYYNTLITLEQSLFKTLASGVYFVILEAEATGVIIKSKICVFVLLK